MDRRTFGLGVAGGLLGTTRAARAQPSRKQRIGTLTGAWGPDHPSVEGLRAGLTTLGLREGRNVDFEHRYTEGNVDAMPGAAAELVASRVDVIFAAAENAALATAKVTKSIPIVFANVGDPVAAGIVRELAHPGGNITGVSNLTTELVPKRLEILKALAPRLRRVWAVYDPTAAESRTEVQKAREAAKALGLELEVRLVSTADEARKVIAAMPVTDGALTFERATSANIGGLLIEWHKLTVYSSAFWLDYGGLVAYGADYHDVGAQAARLVAKILAGTRPRDIPVEGPDKIQLVINMKTAQALGITVPASLLLRADRLIQ
ncbi:MAG: ABC transporter substrate-binding protein [Casimicrobiaceae bacterium]